MNMEMLMKAFDYQIDSGGEYLWHSWENARIIDFQNYKYNAYGSVTHNTKTHEIYEATVYREDENENLIGPYRWMNPLYKNQHEEECKKRNIDPKTSWDNQDWIDIEVDSDFIEKATSIFKGQSFDTRIQVPLELDDDVMMRLMLEAHKRDITLNKMVELLLKEEINMRKVEDDVEHSKFWYDTDRNR